ncbi:uncharacterized protein GGS25DRAFT_374338 [Hypoxylon fragiforme]|uniref:uncharacterized protein n=1 Tax=Hypoxylon fragiforme TaxID=63214 RepID=UPI0020C61B28|nr:uncharacterized protein GGS25DRAFT_374338 [Hypoxylon fragiforme]KAI2606117.1 hypothetical protein GGS25DRAFT_374338 [Hypoxylon fragiforme]
MYNIRRISIAVLAVLIVVFITTTLPRVLNPVPPDKETRDADQQWINTSPHWLDRQTCRWLSLCGLFHLKKDPPEKPKDDGRRHELRHVIGEASEIAWRGGNDGDKKQLRNIPEYVLNYAPLVHLYSQEFFWPSDIAEHIKHVVPDLDEDAWPSNGSQTLTLSNLNELSSELGFQHLNSKDNVESRPKWLHSKDSRPIAFSDEDDKDDGKDEVSEPDRWPTDDTTWFDVDRDHPLHRISDPRKLPGGIPQRLTRRSRILRSRDQQRLISQAAQDSQNEGNKPDESGYSRAPVTLVLVDKGSGIVDAFWFFFYAYNLGQTVLGTRYGNHVGDWEHCMIRFEAGIPRGVFFSEHEGGQAYAWDAVEKRGNKSEIQRPVIYSAVGSHAMYATPGNHAYVLPFGMLKDVTDRGPLWDPSKNLRGYWYDYTTTKDDEGLEPVEENADAPTSWFHYNGTWGDKLFGLDDVRQWRLFGQYHYVTGPQGPKFKNLGRERVCQTWRCRIIHSIAEGKKGSWHS